MNALKKSGKAIIFITHKLHEVREVCDKISILRAGMIVGEADPKKVSNKELANLMVGRPVNLSLERKKNKTGKTILEVDNLSVLNENRELALNQISFNEFVDYVCLSEFKTSVEVINELKPNIYVKGNKLLNLLS